MNYNIYYTGLLNKNSILDIDLDTLNYIIDTYKKGLEDFTVSGKKYYFNRVNNFQIFENNKKYSKDKIIALAKLNISYTNDMFGECVNIEMLKNFGDNVTDIFLKNSAFGSEKKQKKEVQKFESIYINPVRIEELRNIKSTFDLRKLIALCEELNFNFSNENYYSVAMLGRAIIDHIPPIFGMKSFSEVANNYGSKSVKKNLTHLNDSMRNISDGILHSPIRRNESLPNATQVNFSQDLDVLLGEIIVYLK